jgi:phage pi2 protein 07
MNNDIKSQDDIKHQETRSSDVLIKAVEKCEKLEKQLKIAVEGLMTILNDGDDYWGKCQVQYYLKQIKELDK